MEKQTPHYPLYQVKELIEAGKVRSTKAALAGGAALGFDFRGVLAVVAGLSGQEFIKA